VASRALTLRVVSPTATVFQGEVTSVNLPAWDGQVGIFPGHAPYLSLLGGGYLEARRTEGGEIRFFLNRGVVKVEGDRVTILSEYAGDGPPEGFTPGDRWLDLEVEQPSLDRGEAHADA